MKVMFLHFSFFTCVTWVRINDDDDDDDEVKSINLFVVHTKYIEQTGHTRAASLIASLVIK